MAVDHCVTLQELPGLLTKLTKIPAAPEEHPPDALQNDIEFALDQASITDWETTGSIATLTCPECHGPLREMHEGNLFRYRCHTGHGFSLRSLGNALDTDVARALVTALRALQEKELMLRQLAERAISPATAQDWLRRADEYKDHGDRLKRVMHNVRSAPTQDPVGDELGGDAVLAEPASTADDRAPAAEQSRRRRTQAR